MDFGFLYLLNHQTNSFSSGSHLCQTLLKEKVSTSSTDNLDDEDEDDED
jgi:hypothetical protein